MSYYRFRTRRERLMDRLTTLLTGLILSAGGVLLLVPATILLAVPVYVAWNLGVTGLANALGSHVQHISLWTALGGSFILSSLNRIFSNSSPVEITKKKE